MKLLPRSLAQVKGYRTAYVVLVVSLFLTLAGYIGHSRYMTSREEARFAQAESAAIEQTGARLGIYLSMMKGVHALFSASETVSADELARYFQVLKVHDPDLNRGMEGMGVIWKVPAADRKAHEAKLQRKYPDYAIRSQRTNQTLYPIIHFEALGTNTSKALGWDVAENDLRREALEQAERTRKPVISARTELFYPDGSRGPAGFVMYLPVFAQNTGHEQPPVTGFVFGAFDAEKFFRNIFSSSNGFATLEIFDGTNLREEHLLFDHDRHFHSERARAPSLASRTPVEMFGRPWSFYLYTPDAFEQSLERRVPSLLLLLGTLGSFLLFGFVYAQVGARATAESLSRELQASAGALAAANEELAGKVDEARRSSGALAKSLSLQLATLDATGDGILVVDLAGRIVSHNRQFLEMWRIPGNIIGPGEGADSAGLIEYVRSQLKDPSGFVERIKELTAHPELECCDLIQFHDGRIFERHCRPQRIGPEVIGRVMSFRDVTEQRRAAEKIDAEKERLVVTLNSISDAVVATDREGKLLLMNPVAEQLCGLEASSVLEMPIEKVFPLYHPENNAKLPWHLEALSHGTLIADVKPVLLINAMGRQMLVRRRAGPTHGPAGQVTGAVFVFHDVSQEHKAEQELLRASKLESVGLLAGGIAHDFNNVLTGIVGNLSLLKEHPDLTPEVAERLAVLERSAYKARQLTLQLLTFAKGGSPIKQAASIAEVIRESVEFALRGSNLKPEFDFAPDLSVVEIDTGQMSQVVQNLVINAKHAMPEGGVLRISGRNILVSGRENLPLVPGRYVRISVEDFGCGISPENLGRIFDPYFTTKEKGSGLGLATTYSILKRHDGLITAESELGKGSTFYLYLPASDAPAPPSSSDTKIELRGSGKGRILVMDDEPSIRTLLSAILKHFGYDITTVPDGAEAIREYNEARERGEPYAAVIMDLTIPGGMGGKETIRALREIEPNIKAIVSSGYSNDPVLADYQRYGFVARVEKPFRMQELGKVLRAVLQPDA